MPVNRKKRWIIALTAAAVLAQASPAVFADGNYTVPGHTDKPAQIETPAETAKPEETLAPRESAAPEPTGTAESAGTPEKTEKPQFVVPGVTPGPTATAKPPAETAAPTDAPEPSDPAAMSDQAFMDALTLAFMDGIEKLNPDQPRARIQAVMVRVPEERTGSAQWFVNGEARGDYYSSAFPIYTGKTTGIELSVPFSKGMEDSGIDVALEVHLNGAVRRIEKHIEVRNYDDSWYDQKENARVFSMVKPVEIEATVRNWTSTYSNKWLGSTDGSLAAGAQVIYMDHSGDSAAYIWIPEEARACWVPYYSISISDKNYTVYEDFSDEDKEIFVNGKEYDSQSEYLIWINLERQKVNVFQGSKGQWDLIRVSTCSTGKNTTPTPTGVMTYCAYSDGWFNPTYYVKPVLYMNLERAIAMHSILFNPSGTVQDGTQGTPVSHGCVRMPPAEVSWIAAHVPIGTTVVVF